MAEINGIKTLKQFVDDFLFKSGKNTDEYFRYFKIASAGLGHLFMHKLGYITHAKLTVDTDTNTIAFPDDMVGYIKLSVPDSGRMWTLTRDDSIIPTTSTDINGDEYLDTDDGEGVNLGEEVSYIGYGARGGINDYYYSVDHKKRRFIISGISTDFIILSYVSSGISTTSATFIPLYAERALETYIRWQDAWYGENPAWRVYEEEFKQAIREMAKFTAPSFQEIKDSIYRSANQSSHR